MPFVRDDEWRAHLERLDSIETAIVILAKGQTLMSAVTAAAIAKLGALEAKVDQFIGDTQAKEIATAGEVSAIVDRIAAKVVTASVAALSTDAPAE